jgi:hypothetical protein
MPITGLLHGVIPSVIPVHQDAGCSVKLLNALPCTQRHGSDGCDQEYFSHLGPRLVPDPGVEDVREESGI